MREQSVERPVLILSQDIFNDRSGTVKAMALTSQEQRAGFPLTHEMIASKLPKRSRVKIRQIRTLPTKRIGKRIGSPGPDELAHVIEGFNEIIGGLQTVAERPGQIVTALACATAAPSKS